MHRVRLAATAVVIAVLIGAPSAVATGSCMLALELRRGQLGEQCRGQRTAQRQCREHTRSQPLHARQIVFV